jgi:hypothetical protein
VSFPFFSDEKLCPKDKEFPLFLRVFHPEVEGVSFIGLAQPLGAIMPIAEAQARWVAAHLSGRYTLPPRTALRRRTERDHQRMRERFVRSPRHTMQIDFDEYLTELEREMLAGARRFTRRGGAGRRAPSGWLRLIESAK